MTMLNWIFTGINLAAMIFNGWYLIRDIRRAKAEREKEARTVRIDLSAMAVPLSMSQVRYWRRNPDGSTVEVSREEYERGIAEESGQVPIEPPPQWWPR